MSQAQLATGDGMGGREIASAVICHDPLDVDAERGEPCEPASEEPSGGVALLIAEHLGVCETTAIVDHHMDVVPAVSAASVASPDDPLAGDLETSEPLDIDMNELAWLPTLVAVGRLRWVQPRALAQANPL